MSDAIMHDTLRSASKGIGEDIIWTQAVFDIRYNEVMEISALDTSSGGDMGNRLTATAVERTGLSPVVAEDFDTVQVPTNIRMSNSDTDIVTASKDGISMTQNKQAVD